MRAVPPKPPLLTYTRPMTTAIPPSVLPRAQPAETETIPQGARVGVLGRIMGALNLGQTQIPEGEVQVRARGVTLT